LIQINGNKECGLLLVFGVNEVSQGVVVVLSSMPGETFWGAAAGEADLPTRPAMTWLH
jgi:hypothetical protein